MKHKKNILAYALLAPALIAMESAGESPSFSPSEGTTLSKRVERTLALGLDENTVIVDGVDRSGEMPGMEVDTEVTVVTAVTDRYLSMSDGRLTKLSRTFDELSSVTTMQMSSPMGDADSEMNGASALEGKTVIFTWDDDAEDYTAKFDEESSGDEELLTDLAADLDFIAFLPSDDVSEGDSWDVDPDALVHVLSPSGDVKVVPEEDESGAGAMMGDGSSGLGAFLQDFDGEITATFQGTRDEDGTTVAVIKLEFDVSSATDMTESVRESMEGQEMFPGVEADIESADMEFTFEGDGELLWNVADGVFHSLALEGDVEQVIDQVVSLMMGENERTFDTSKTFGGTESIEITTD